MPSSHGQKIQKGAKILGRKTRKGGRGSLARG